MGSEEGYVIGGLGITRASLGRLMQVVNDGMELGLVFEVCVKGTDTVWGSTIIRGQKRREAKGGRPGEEG